ncbi:hypothetical protein DMN91_007416 [Ooceraea biroi]|uniref:Uncharacterized protein n=1 Tax=Ooceraea biroi TaxID=2015173 RepID=A0A3L8DKV7_OOCBI|nr:hypothetical protein DMN91_007416 [Ooceraea biroi]
MPSSSRSLWRTRRNSLQNDEDSALKNEIEKLQGDLSAQESTVDWLQKEVPRVQQLLEEKDRDGDALRQRISLEAQEMIKKELARLDRLDQSEKNMELTNNIEGLEANRKQLENIIDLKTNELMRSNQLFRKCRPNRNNS